jgi:hypothetical protein
LKHPDFDSLPKGLKKRIVELHPSDYQSWVHKEIPALDGHSIIETINSEDGMVKLNQYLRKIESYLGIS